MNNASDEFKQRFSQQLKTQNIAQKLAINVESPLHSITSITLQETVSRKPHT